LLEDLVFFFKIEQGPRGNGHHQFAVQRTRHVSPSSHELIELNDGQHYRQPDQHHHCPHGNNQ
jgi:hypothetical protein